MRYNIEKGGDILQSVFICIDLKSFYASAECSKRELDALDTNLVVADTSRTEKTICLAVSPSLKALGVPSRPRLFEVLQRVKEINKDRKRKNGGRAFVKKSVSIKELNEHPDYELDFICATPKMSMYIDISTKIYSIYLRYIAKEDIHVYSIDEVFMDVSGYLATYKIKSNELAKRMIKDILNETGITATAGIGTNLYLAKVAMDVLAKHVKPDAYGVRIAWLNEERYKRLLWDHRPLTDFWRVGHGISKKLEKYGMFTMGDIARCSLGGKDDILNEDLLFKLFGVNAELLIDHAWGYEPCRMIDIKNYKPISNSLSTNQVLHCPMPYKVARLTLHEMCDQFALDMVEKNLVTKTMILTIGYDKDNIDNGYNGEIMYDYVGRVLPKFAHGTISFDKYTSAESLIISKMDELYLRIVNKNLTIRRIGIGCNVINRDLVKDENKGYEQLNLFIDYDKKEKERLENEKKLEKEHNAMVAIVKLKKKYGKNSVLKGMNLEEGATQIERNKQIGGHKA